MTERHNSLLDATVLVTGDVPCHRCGYNLRTLARDANCPECAASVNSTIDVIESRSLAWLERLQTGANLIAFLHAGISAALALSLPMYFVTHILGPLIGVIAILSLTAGISGFVALTSPHPYDDRNWTSLRRRTRWTLLSIPFLLVTLFVHFLYQLSVELSGGRVSQIWEVALMAQWAILGLLILASPFLLTALRFQLGRELGIASDAHWERAYRWLALSIVACVACVAAIAIGMPSKEGLRVMYCATGAAVVTFNACAAVVMRTLGQQIRARADSMRSDCGIAADRAVLSDAPR